MPIILKSTPELREGAVYLLVEKTGDKHKWLCELKGVDWPVVHIGPLTGQNATKYPSPRSGRRNSVAMDPSLPYDHIPEDADLELPNDGYSLTELLPHERR